MVPGYFHLTWHCAKVVFKVWGAWGLTQMGLDIGRTRRDLDNNHEAKNMRAVEGFLKAVAQAGLQLIETGRRQRHLETLDELCEVVAAEDNKTMASILYMLRHFIWPFITLRHAIRGGDHDKVEELLPWWFNLFWITKKRKYANLVLNWMHTLRVLNDEWKPVAIQAALVNVSGHGVFEGGDDFIEDVNKMGKCARRAANNAETIRTRLTDLNVLMPFKKRMMIETVFNNKDKEVDGVIPDTEAEKKTVSALLKLMLDKAKWFGSSDGTLYNKDSPMDGVQAKLDDWWLRGVQVMDQTGASVVRGKVNRMVDEEEETTEEESEAEEESDSEEEDTGKQVRIEVDNEEEEDDDSEWDGDQ